MKPVFTGFYFLMMVCFANAQSWKEITRFSPQQTIQKIRFLTSELGYCVSSLYNGSTMNIHKTTNGGLSWTDQSSGYSNPVYGHFYPQRTNRFLGPPADWIRRIKFVNTQVGYACADIGRIYKTVDGGTKWTSLNSGVQEPLMDLDFADVLTGVVVGFNGTILKTTDGGQSWTQMPSPLGPEHLFSVDLVNQNSGFICTCLGRILRNDGIAQRRSTLKIVNSNLAKPIYRNY
ncbi:MAG: hypothetical protein IPF46_00635 [Saprospiraceae bacterium]|nr:hypothetical protein [Candidatus Vicinibacter affinis]